MNALHDDLANSYILIKPKSTLCEPVNQCNETLSKLLDKHAPKQTKVYKFALHHYGTSNEKIIDIDILTEFGDELVLHLIDPVILNSYIYAITHVKSKVWLLYTFYLNKFWKPSPDVEICKHNSTSAEIKSTAWTFFIGYIV